MKKETLREQIDFVLENIHNYQKIVSVAYALKERLIELVADKVITELEFYKITSLLTPQSRSPLWEKYFIIKHGCNKITAQKNSGDFEKNGQSYEYKASGFNQDEALHVVQVRLWQECDYIIQSISDEKVFTFLVSHTDMKEEIGKCKASSAHGTKQSNEENRNIELKFTVKRGSAGWARWCERYLVPHDEVFRQK